MAAAVVSKSAERGFGGDAGRIRLCTSFSLRRMLRMRWVELIPLGPTSTRMLSASIRIGHLPVRLSQEPLSETSTRHAIGERTGKGYQNCPPGEAEVLGPALCHTHCRTI
jgi:hypothetical protein